MSLPPSATPRSVAPREDVHASILNDTRYSYHRPSVASKKSIPDTGPASTATSYHLSSIAPSTPYSAVATPGTVNAASHLQPSIQYDRIFFFFFYFKIYLFFPSIEI
jgi:hypothetical protein